MQRNIAAFDHHSLQDLPFTNGTPAPKMEPSYSQVSLASKATKRMGTTHFSRRTVYATANHGDDGIVDGGSSDGSRRDNGEQAA